MTKKIEITDADLRFLEIAAEKSLDSVERGGGPFGAVIVKNNEIIAVFRKCLYNFPFMRTVNIWN